MVMLDFHNGKQMVEINGTLSKSRIMGCGVPQGSILGPLVLLYINDLKAATSCMIFCTPMTLFYWLHIKIRQWLRIPLMKILNRWLAENKLLLQRGKN